MKFILNVNTENASFHTEDCDLHEPHPNERPCCDAVAVEIIKILQRVTNRIKFDGLSGLSGLFETVRDSNGNDVGRFAIKPNDYK